MPQPWFRKPPLRLTLICSLISFCANWQFGYQITYVNTAVQTFYKLFLNTYRMDKQCPQCPMPYDQWSAQWSLAVASFYPGALIGFILVPTGVRYVGVRYTMLMSGVPAVIGCVLQFFARVEARLVGEGRGDMVLVEYLTIGRALIGIHGGAALALLPLFINEISPPIYRGFLASFQQVAQALTSLIGFCFGSEAIFGIEKGKFEWLQVVALVPTLVLILTLFLIRDSPYEHLVRRSNWTEGEKSIRFYYGSSANLQLTSVAILQEGVCGASHHATNNTVSSLYNILCPKSTNDRLVTKGLILGCLAAVSYAFTADDLIDSFSSHIFQNLGRPEEKTGRFTADMVTVGIGLILLAASLCGTVLIERFGRKPMLIGGLFGTAVCNGGVVFFSLLPRNVRPVADMIAFGATKAFIGAGAGAPAWFLTGELVPPDVRSLAQSISTGLLLLASGTVTVLYLRVEQIFGNFSLLLLASLPALICAIILLIFLPETREMDYDHVKRRLASNRLCQMQFDEDSDTESERLLEAVSKVSLASTSQKKSIDYGTIPKLTE